MCDPLEAQLILNQGAVTVTSSLKSTTRLASTATPVAPSPGVVLETVGATSPPQPKLFIQLLLTPPVPAAGVASVLAAPTVQLVALLTPDAVLLV